MKKLLVTTCLTVVAVAMASTSFAASYGAAGCGLGSVLFKDQPGPIQVVAATTNGISGNQTFGITSGTLNCGAPLYASNNQINNFVAENMDTLARDIAQGQGATLTAFAELLQIPAAEQGEFANKLQANFDKVFTSDQVVMADVIDNTVSVIN
ncbi:MAG: DUF3015 family protein [Desulfuromonadales bacterium]|jgi:hypothetical protein|nr:DUF3015 family protein [Desulfuromonadales bacterium]